MYMSHLSIMHGYSGRKTRTDVGYSSSQNKRRWQSLTMSQKRAVAVFGGKRTFVWKDAKLPVNGRRIMPVVFVSLELRSFDICRKNLIRRSRIKRLDFEPRFCHQTLSHKWSYMDIIMRPFNLFAQLNPNNYIAKLFFWKLMNVCIVSTLHYIMINVITA